MPVKKYTNNAWQDITTLKKYRNNAWEECSTAKKYNNNAWQDVWSRGMSIRFDRSTMSNGASYTLSLRDNGYGIDYSINGAITEHKTPHAIVFAIYNPQGFYTTKISFSYSMSTSSMLGGMYLMKSDLSTRLYQYNDSTTVVVTDTFTLSGDKLIYFLIDAYESATNSGHLTNVYINDQKLKFFI